MAAATRSGVGLWLAGGAGLPDLKAWLESDPKEERIATESPPLLAALRRGRR